MSNQTNITVYDGATPPVAHTLVPIGVAKDAKDGIVAEWRESILSLPNEAQVRLKLTLKKMSSGVWRSEVRVEIPVMEAVAGQNSSGYTAAPKVAYIDTQVITGFHHPRSTVASRRLCRQMTVNLAGNVSTSVTPIATGFIPELIDQLIAAS